MNGPAKAELRKRRAVGRVVHIETDTLADLLRLPDRRTFTGLRDYALMLFSLDCGARLGESLQLRAGDFNLPGLLVTIPAPVAKTRQSRTVPHHGANGAGSSGPPGRASSGMGRRPGVLLGGWVASVN